jgi:nucleotide-binding universal stress UspA family protein
MQYLNNGGLAMKLLNKILLATDFSKSSEQAMHMAIRLAKIFNSEILILHVIPLMKISKLNKEMIEKSVGLELKRIHDKISSEGIKVNDIGLQSGIPFIRIIQESDKQNVNVILMGSGKKDEAEGKLTHALGVTAEKVLHKAAKPVWVIKSDNDHDFKNILCPIDFSKPAERALKNAIHLVRKMNAKLHILHVVPSMMDFYLNIIGESEEKQADEISNHQKQLDKFLEQFDFHGVTFEKIVKPGKVHRLILETAINLETDLILMGTSGESNNKKILMGTNTKYVTRELPCSIITVKSESFIQPMIDYKISDLESHFNLGKDFLNNGMPQEAIEQFRYCVEKNVLYAPAWEGLALGHERLGSLESAKEYRQKAKDIRDKLWQQRVEAELRSKHELFGNKRKF